LAKERLTRVADKEGVKSEEIEMDVTPLLKRQAKRRSNKGGGIKDRDVSTTEKGRVARLLASQG